MYAVVSVVLVCGVVGFAKSLFGRGSAERRRGTRLFFATDIHGSEECFRKFLNAGEFYDVAHLILGGDMTGKFLVPIVEEEDHTYSVTYGDRAYNELSKTAVKDVIQRIRRSGHYPVIGTHDELTALGDEQERDRRFRKIVYDSVADWVALAETRLSGTGRRCFMAPGNDDFLEIDGALKGSEIVEFAEGRCLTLDEDHEMITTGYSNPTPWNTERELGEGELKARIVQMAEEARHAETVVAVLHAPPFDSGLDQAPELDDDLRVQGGGGLTAAVGSTAVREYLEEYQPLVGLHGHVHEGTGTARLGRTLCINPGSEYTEGVLAGAIVEVAGTEVLRHQLVRG